MATVQGGGNGNMANTLAAFSTSSVGEMVALLKSTRKRCRGARRVILDRVYPAIDVIMGALRNAAPTTTNSVIVEGAERIFSAVIGAGDLVALHRLADISVPDLNRAGLWVLADTVERKRREHGRQDEWELE